MLLPLPGIEPRMFKYVEWLLYLLSYHIISYYIISYHIIIIIIKKKKKKRRRIPLFDFWCLYHPPPFPRHVKFEMLMAVSTKSRLSGMWRRVVLCRYGNVKSDRFCYVKCSVERTGEILRYRALKGCGERGGHIEWRVMTSVLVCRPLQPALISVTL